MSSSSCLSFLIGIISMTTIHGLKDRRIRMKEGDPRLVPCERLMISQASSYSHEEIFDYSVVLVRLQANQIIVGARNFILRLNLSNFTELEKVQAFSDDVITSTCHAKGQNTEECHNFLRVLIANNDEVLTCGTNSFSPRCQWRQIDRLSNVLSQMSGVGKCPFSPHQNSTLIMTSDLNFYGATVTDFAARDPAIYRMMGTSRHLRTNQYNSRWLNEPDFVSSYEIGPYVYFFFRETAIEYINCGKAIYSRVARICQNDQGGNVLLQDNWTTFSKSRLNCSMPGPYPFHFNEIQSTYHDVRHGLIYAVFTTSPTAILGSAVCVYNLSSFEVSFHGPFKYQVDSNSAWMRVPNKLPHYQCGHNSTRHPTSSSSSSSSPENTHSTHVLLETSKYQLMDRSVQPCDILPVVIAEGERYTHIVKDEVWLPHQNLSIVVLFLASLSGYIDKIAILPTHKNGDDDDDDDDNNYDGGDDDDDQSTSCLVERLMISCSSAKQQRVRSLELISSHKVLIIGTNEGLYKIPIQRCFRFKTKEKCHNSQDPYCGWSRSRNSCLPNGHQNFTSCPIINTSVDGNFCPWSPWQPCHYVTHPPTHQSPHQTIQRNMTHARCSCRTRNCACPQTGYGGNECIGHSVEITNCSQFNGRRHLSPSSSFWSPWSEWTSCAGSCSQGHQIRSRLCFLGHDSCLGNNKEIKMCKMGTCEDGDSWTDWTRWHVINKSEMVRMEERHRCICRGDLRSNVKQPVLETSKRVCNNNFHQCSNESYAQESTSLIWSSWSECSVSCGRGGVQRRQKTCLNGEKSCSKDNSHHLQSFQEVRPCRHQIPCQTSFWSCWSPFNPCSSTCGRGIKFRTRICLDRFKTLDITESEDYDLSDKCSGSSKQEIVCSTAFCDQKHYVDGDEIHYQPEDFDDVNFKDDSNDKIFDNTEEFHGKPTTVIQYYHLIIVGIICFLLGGIVIIVFLSHYKPSLLFGWERFLPSIDGVSTEKCEVVTAFSSNCIPTALARYPHLVANGIASANEEPVQQGSCSTTNSSQAPLVDMKRRSLKT